MSTIPHAVAYVSVSYGSGSVGKLSTPWKTSSSGEFSIVTNSGEATPASVLVAEDDRVMADVIRFNLERAGYRVTVARNGLEAWGQLQSNVFQVFVADYQMPGMNGVEVCRALRTTYPDVQLSIIFLSARGLELDVGQMKEELKIETLLFKPFSPRELVAEIAKCLRSPDKTGCGHEVDLEARMTR